MFEFHEVRRLIEIPVARKICEARLGAPPPMAALAEEIACFRRIRASVPSPLMPSFTRRSSPPRTIRC